MVKYKVRFVVNWLSIEGVPGRQPGTAIKLKWKKSTFNRGSSNPAPVVQGSARWQDSRSNVTTTLVWPVGGHPYNRNVVRVTVIECHPRVGGGWLGFLFKGGFHHSRKIGIAEIGLHELFRSHEEDSIVPVSVRSTTSAQSPVLWISISSHTLKIR